MKRTTDLLEAPIGGVELLAVALDVAAIAHESGDLEGLEGIQAVIESFEVLGDGLRGTDLAFGLNFLDGWVDAANHDWRQYEGISKAEWPRLGRLIARSLRRSRRI